MAATQLLLLLAPLFAHALRTFAAPCAFTAPAGPNGDGLASARAFLASALASRNHTLSEDLVICLAPGIHSVALQSHALTSAHGVRGGAGRVVWRGGSGAAAISGGLQVTGWVPTSLAGRAAFVAPVPSPLAAAGVAVRQLWVRGARAARTRVEGAALGACAPWRGAGGAAGLECASVPAAWALNSTTAIEFTWPIVVRNWIAPRCTLASVRGGNVTLAAPCGAFLAARWGGKLDSPVSIEAAPAFPLPAGVFWHDRDGGRLFYAPAANQTAADLEADSWVAAQEVLSSLEDVSGHTFEGVNFTYGAWGQANSGEGFVDDQAAVFACSAGNPLCEGGAAEPRGNVRVVGGAGVTFVGCAFSHLGAAYALSIMGGAKDPVVRSCAFTDLSGGFLKLGSVTMAQNGGTNASLWDAGASITHNTASDMAIEYGGACGYFGGFLFSATVSHNTVADAGYSGFSQGWGWGTLFPAGAGNNTISYNKIVNVMRVLRDGGGIYVNGAENKMWPSSMHHNFVDGDLAVVAVYC
jgi:hypothetical protein